MTRIDSGGAYDIKIRALPQRSQEVRRRGSGVCVSQHAELHANDLDVGPTDLRVESIYFTIEPVLQKVLISSIAPHQQNKMSRNGLDFDSTGRRLPVNEHSSGHDPRLYFP